VVCESCHRQLFQQWDVFQKANKPVTERFYQLVRPTKPNSVLSFPFHHDQLSSVIGSTSVPSSTSSSVRTNNNHIPPISFQQSTAAALQVASVATKTLFVCVVCGKDLLLAAASVSIANQPNTTNAHMAFSMVTEAPSANDATPNNSLVTSVKKVIVQSAQEVNLLPFLSTSSSTYPAALQQQLQLLLESGRVLACCPCFESFSSRCSSSSTSTPSNSANNNVHNSESVLKSVAGRSLRDSLNGNYCSLLLTDVFNSWNL